MDETFTGSLTTSVDISEIQKQREISSINAGVDRYHRRHTSAVATHTESQSQVGQELFNECIEPLTTEIMQFLTAPKMGRPHLAKGFLLKFKPSEESEIDGAAQRAALVISRVVIDWLSSETEASELCRKIASAVLDHLRDQKIAEKQPERAEKQKAKFNALRTTSLGYMRDSLRGMNRDVDLSEFKLTGGDRLVLGGKCLDLFIKATNLIEQVSEPVERISTGNKFKSRRVIVATQATQERLKRRHDVLQDRDPIYSPSITKPAKWNNIGDGGYGFDLEEKFCLLLKRGKRSLDYLKGVEMPKVYTAINALQETSWQVNKRVWDVVCMFDEVGNRDLKIPREKPYFDMATKEPIDYPKPPDIDTDDDALTIWKNTKNVERAKEKSRRQKRREFDQTTDVVRGLLNERDEAGKPRPFYFPYRLDFRGRAYAIPLYFRPQGRDLEKGLLMFGDGKPLGSEEAVRWLAIHGVNCLEKDPFTEGLQKLTKLASAARYTWIEDHTEDICNVAADPIRFQWWTKADSPLCFLAFCFEWSSYKQMAAQGSGLDFVSYLPIALDGSCNGLQHFSCLLLDERLGESVNLLPGTEPRDLYEEIATEVRKKLSSISQDQIGSLKAAQADDLLNWGKVDRKFLKRNVMALPYGSNQHGFTDQYQEFMKDPDNSDAMEKLSEIIEERTGNKNAFGHFVFLAGVVWKTLSDESGPAQSAVDAMDWFKKLAGLAAKTQKPIRWKTPSGFIVEMDYREEKVRQVEFVLQNVRYKPVDVEEKQAIDKKKQRSRISANIIHSLDAAHLMQTVWQIYRDSHGNVKHFSMIHDSFGTHAADTGHLCSVIKDQLCLMYRRNDVLGGIEKDILSNVKAGIKIPSRPSHGKLQLTQIPQAHFSFI